jgi:hypothetical protein
MSKGRIGCAIAFLAAISFTPEIAAEERSRREPAREQDSNQGDEAIHEHAEERQD